MALLARDPHAEGHVRLTMNVNCEGRIWSMRAQVQGVDKSTIDCIFDAAHDAQFPLPAGGARGARIIVPLTFVIAPESQSPSPHAQ